MLNTYVTSTTTHLLIWLFKSSLICGIPSLFALGKIVTNVDDSWPNIGTTAKKKLLSTWCVFIYAYVCGCLHVYVCVCM